MTTYIIKQIESFEDYSFELNQFIFKEVPELNKTFGGRYDFRNADLASLIEKGIFLVCERDGEITGIMIAYLSKSVFDINITILQQQLLFVKPDSGRSAYHLFKKFIDIGKSKADHIITMLTSHTNIKPSTLENMGFKELETLYIMEN